jgi:recombination protein RecT
MSAVVAQRSGSTDVTTRQTKMGGLIKNRAKMIEAMFQDEKEAARFRAIAVSVTSNYKLAACTDDSLMDCVLGIAQLGLSIDPNFGQAYIIPYQVKDKNDKSKVVCTVAQLQVGYKGYKQLLYRAGWFTNAYPVYKCDKFEQFFNNEDMEMKYHFEPNLDERDTSFKWVYENLRGIFTVAKDAYGNRETKFLSKKDIEKLRLKSDNQTVGKEPEHIWREWYEEMALGKAVKKVSKQLPIADKRVLAVLSADDKTEVGAVISYQKTFEAGEVTETEIEEPKTDLNELVKQNAQQTTQVQQPTQTEPPAPDKYQNLTVALRKQNIALGEAPKFAEFYGLTDEQLALAVADIENSDGFKKMVEAYKIEMTKE